MVNKESLKIVFFGTPDFAVESLRRLYTDGYNIAGVVTMPDKTGGRGHKLIQSPVKEYAIANGIKVLQPASLKDEKFIAELRSLNADLQIVIAFRMLPEVVWNMPPLGTFNLHASLLPKYRGAAPINWAVINGEKETGVTTFFLKHEIDTGDIIQQERIVIADHDNAGSIHDRLMVLGADMVVKTVDSIIDGTIKSIPQDILCAKDVQPVPAPKIFTETRRIDWSRNAVDIHNLVRGLSPYPAAWTAFYDNDGNEFQIKIFETEIVKTERRECYKTGEIITGDCSLKIMCGDMPLEILSVQLSGKKRMSAADFLRGFNPGGMLCR